MIDRRENGNLLITFVCIFCSSPFDVQISGGDRANGGGPPRQQFNMGSNVTMNNIVNAMAASNAAPPPLGVTPNLPLPPKTTFPNQPLGLEDLLAKRFSAVHFHQEKFLKQILGEHTYHLTSFYCQSQIPFTTVYVVFVVSCRNL